MADGTVKQLATTVGAPADRLLKQMQDAGLSHASEDEVVTEEQKQALLAFLKRSHGETAEAPKKITLKRKSTGTLKAGQGRAGRNVTVEVRRKRTYVKGGEAELEAVPAAPTAPEPGAAAVEAKRIREEELARQTAEEQARTAEAERKAEAARKVEEERARAEEEAHRQELEKEEQERLAALDKTRGADASPEAGAPAVSAADVQAKEQAEQRGGKRAKAKDKDRRDDFGDSRGRRRELSLKSERRTRRKQPHRQTALQVDQQGGEFKPTDFISREVAIGEVNTVGDLAQGMAVKVSEVIKTLMGLGGLVIDGKETHRRAIFGRHVGDRRAVG
jgi:translation initiation factor IF-2